MSEPTLSLHPVPAHAARAGAPVRWLLVLGVLLLHGVAIWALQAGLLVRAVEWVVPVQVLADVPDAPSPSPPSPPAVPPHAAPVATATAPVKPVLAHTPPPPQALPETPLESVPPVAAPSAVVVAPEPTPAAPAVAPPASPVAALELPSSDAAYLRNPPPAYPLQSVRLGEQGEVLLRVFIDTDGRASQAEILRSSGFERLDQVALQTVRRWRYVPGKRAGVPEAMWTTVPLSFVLN